MEYFFCPSTILFDIWPGRSNDPGKIYIAIKWLFLLATKTKTKIFSHYHRVFLSPIFVDIWPWRSDAGSVSPIFALVSPSIHANNAAWNIQNIYQQYLFIKERRLSYVQNIHMKWHRASNFSNLHKIWFKYFRRSSIFNIHLYIYPSQYPIYMHEKLFLPAGKQWPGLSPSPKVVVSTWKRQN